MKYPKSKRELFIDEYGSNFIGDEFNWLTDPSEKEVVTWLSNQHEFTSNYFSNIDGFSERLKKISTDTPVNGFRSLSYSNGLYTGVYDDMTTGLTAFESEDLENLTVLQVAGDPYTTIFSAEASPVNSNIYVFSGYYKNETRVSNNVFDKDKNKVVSRFGFGFDYHLDKSGKFIYYSEAKLDKNDHSKSTQNICRYNVESNSSEILYVYEADAVVVYFDQCGDDILVNIDTNYHDSKLLVIHPDGSVKHLSDVLPVSYSFIGLIADQLYFVSDENGDKYEIVHFSLKDGIEGRKVLPNIRAYEMSAKVVNDHIMVISKVDAEDILVVYAKDGTLVMEITLPSEYASLRIIGDSEEKVFMHFDSLIEPEAIIEFDKNSFEVKTIKSLSNDTKADITVKKHKVKLRDGETSTLYLAHSSKVEPNSDSPLLIYGYGGYGASQSLGYRDPITDYSIKEWCEKGGVYVNVILRGGGEYGLSWHEAGRLDNKFNTFNDLFDMTDYVHNLGISNPSKSAVGGASNGGLLVSAAYAHRPDLYACILDSVGLADMLHFVKDPRGSMYKTEYGDPYDPKMFDYLKEYSPYHQLEVNVDYPAIYIQSGLLDTNVPPYHGMKFAAKAQHVNPSGNPILLRVLPHGHHDSGHGDERYETIAERQIFLEKTLGI